MTRGEVLAQLAKILLAIDRTKVSTKKQEEEMSYQTIWDMRNLLQAILLEEKALSAVREDQDSLGVRAPMGLTAVLGAGASGKSVFLRMLAQKAEVELVSMGEYGSKKTFSITRILGDTNDRPLIVVVDSLKDLWSTGIMNIGNTMPGGVTTTGAVFLSLLNQLLAFAGRSVVAAFNPLMIGSRSEASAIALQEFLGSELSGLVVCKQGHIDAAYGKFLDADNIAIREPLDIIDHQNFEEEYKRWGRSSFSFENHMGPIQTIARPLKDINVFGPLLADT